MRRTSIPDPVTPPSPEDCRYWSSDEDEVLRARIARGDRTAEIAVALDRSYKSVEQRILRIGVQRFRRRPAITREVLSRSNVSVLAPISTAPEPDDVFLSRAIDRTTQSLVEHQEERYAVLRIVSDVPVGISLSSDWHITTTGPCAVKELVEYAEAVRETPNAYALGVGDMTDNPIKWAPTSVNDIPDDLRLLDIVIGKFGGKLLGMTSGNHDDWTKAMVGIDSLRTMAERHALHYAPDELIWRVEIVSPTTNEVTARWVIATRHKYYRHSNLNHTHACYRWLEDNANNWPVDDSGATLLPDVLAVGHNHVADVSHRVYEGRDVIAVRMGAWQYTSRHTRAGGWPLMPPTAPVVVLPPSRDQNPSVFVHWRMGLDALHARA